VGGFFAPIVNWITRLRTIPGQGQVHRTARADFNVRRRQGRLRHTAPAALFFFGVDLTKITDIQQLLPIVDSKPERPPRVSVSQVAAYPKRSPL
jgi:hypothetical protein